MTTHTPTPWILGAKTTYHDDHLTQNIDSGPRDKGGVYIANAFLPDDAAFIVRAVNAHEALLDAAKIALCVYQASQTSMEERTAIGLLEKAIAKADGRA